MKKIKIALKNFSAGRKALLKRILVYVGSSFAVYEIVSAAINSDSLSAALSDSVIYQTYIYPVLNNLFIYLGIAVILALLMQIGFSSYSNNLSGSDVKVSLQIGDIFDCDGGIIVPSNNIFAHDGEIIGTKSIQYQLLKKCENKKLKYTESAEDQIQKALNTPEFQNALLPAEPQVLAGKEFKKYEYGMILPLKLLQRKKDKFFYLLSMSEILSEGRPHVSNKVLLQSIDKMWENIKSNRLYDDEIVVPVMGTGAAGMVEKPKHIIAKYLIKSFADNADKLGIKHLTICIYPGDYLNNEINMDELRRYVNYICEFPDSEFIVSDPE